MSDIPNESQITQNHALYVKVESVKKIPQITISSFCVYVVHAHCSVMMTRGRPLRARIRCRLNNNREASYMVMHRQTWDYATHLYIKESIFPLLPFFPHFYCACSIINARARSSIVVLLAHRWSLDLLFSMFSIHFLLFLQAIKYVYKIQCCATVDVFIRSIKMGW